MVTALWGLSQSRVNSHDQISGWKITPQEGNKMVADHLPWRGQHRLQLRGDAGAHYQEG